MEKIRDHRLGTDALFFCIQHDGSAVGVVGAKVAAVVPVHLEIAIPDIAHRIFDEVTQVNIAVGIGQGCCDEDFARLEHGHVIPIES